MTFKAKRQICKDYVHWKNKMNEWIDSIDEYTEIQDKESLRKSINSYVDTWIDFIHADDRSEHMSEFWNFTNDLDAIRGESFSDVFPELSNLLADYHKKPEWWFLPTERYNKE